MSMSRADRDALRIGSSAISSRRKRAAECFAAAAVSIGPVERGMSLFCITRGQWSMIDAILHCLDCVGNSALSVWTWTVAEYEVQVLERLMLDKRLIGGTLIIDHGAKYKNRAVIAQWKSVFGPESVKYVINHAKIATIESTAGHRLLLRGSMNLNRNPRFEQFDITEGGEDFDLVRDIESDAKVIPDDCTGDQVYQNSKGGDAWGEEAAVFFKGAKVWSK